MKRSATSIRDFIAPKSYLTRDEFDVMNEWVAVIWTYRDKENGLADLKRFTEMFNVHERQSDIYLIRSDRESDAWMLVIDFGTGKATKALVLRELARVKKKFNSGRNKRNDLGQWFDNSYPHFYQQASFEYYNGSIANIHDLGLLKK